MKDLKTYELIHRHLAGELEEGDQVDFEQIDSQTKEEIKTVWEAAGNYSPSEFVPNKEKSFANLLSRIEDEKANNATEQRADTPVITLTERQISQSNDKPNRQSFLSIKTISSIAAIFVIGLCAVFAMNIMTGNTITGDGLTYAALPDGSQVWLSDGAKLSYKDGFGSEHRNLKFQGKGYYKVAKNAALPFEISGGSETVTVLGTEFTYDNTSDDADNFVSVREGKVRVSDESDKVVLTANQKINLTTNSTAEAEAADFVWRNEQLSFDNATLQQVFSDLDLFKGIQIKMDQKINCSFSSSSLLEAEEEDIINIIEAAVQADIVKTADGSYNVKSIDCN